MAEIFLSAILPTLFEKLTSSELLEFATREGIRSKLNKLKETLDLINALLVDAEEKQLANSTVKIWLEQIQDLAYDAEDVLDEYATEALRRKLKIQQHRASTSRARKFIPARCIGFTPSALWSDLSMHSKIDYITSRLEDLCKKKHELGLVELGTPRGRTTTSWQRRTTTSLSIERAVFGREEDKAKILKMVFSNERGHANFGVISIVGMGGLGKTTLAREVFNDKEVQDFKPRVWVCVSDDFDVMRISMAILESINRCGSDLRNLDEVQKQLKEKVAGEKFLLVLDDVWSEDYSKWELLRSPFMVGDPRSKIIVTTRHERVASKMGCSTGCTHKLKLLSDDECWSLFEKHAFGNGVVGADASESIREKVIGKCKGLPLVAKTLGGLLLNETRDKWLVILNSKLWDNESEIPAALQISYHHLPSHLKRCFAYCAILPKDYEFEEKELVFLWMAEGFIQQSSENKSFEDLGGEYFLDLLSRSFFQISSSNNSKYVMHDLINDLAQTISRNVCFKLEDAPKNLSPNLEKARYASYTCHQYNDKRKFEVFNDAVHLRTHLSVSQINYRDDACFISNMVVFDLFSRFKKLRVLSLQRYYIVELPNSIGDLRLLRYLNLSYSLIRSLPKSVNSMCNLQTLLLRNCKSLLKLPSNMENLINLRHLDILGVSLIEKMPSGVRNWECLQTLSNFIVGKNSGANLKDLEDLKSLCGELHISRLENATNFQDIKKVILSDKKDLKVLSLEWTSRFNESQDAKILDMLQPHKNLEKLTIRGYRGTKFSSWVGGSSFLESNIGILELIDCKNCTFLPSLGLLGSLKILTIEGMKGIKSIGFEFYGEHCAKPFQFLETLCFKDLEEWESWDPVKENDSFFKLQELSIINCPKLSKRLPNNLPSLKKLVVQKCGQLVVSLTNIPTLCVLELDECKKIVHNSSIFYESLESLTLSNITDVGDWSLQKFKKVQSLQIEGCKELIELWQNEMLLKKPHQRLHSISLKSLNLDNCDTLTTTLFERIKQTDVCLEELSISRCNSLNFIFKGEPPQYLKKLCIKNCEKLEGLLDSNEVVRTSELEAVNTLTSHIEDLVLSECPSLTCLHSGDLLSATLTSLDISYCSKLTTLSLTGRLPVALKHLKIFICSELTTVLPKGHLPETLETLFISGCNKLESIVHKFHNNNTLYEIHIFGCEKLKSLPEGLDTLTSLRSIVIMACHGFTAFPTGGFPSSNLRVSLYGCSKVEALPSGIHTLSSLLIHYCPNMSLSEEGLPTKLTRLSIKGHKQYKALMERGLHDFTSLEFLCISGGSDRECIQEEDMTITLPSSLTDLQFERFPKLKNLSFKGVQDLSSLKFLKINNCPELTSLPSLPSSLERLDIGKCPLLKKACKRDKGKEWSKIADIPCVEIDDKFIYDP